jgi:hypothetical protein
VNGASGACGVPEVGRARYLRRSKIQPQGIILAGVGPQQVDAAVDAAAADYVDARVHASIGILVERQVRSALHLRTPDLTDGGAGENAGTPG